MSPRDLSHETILARLVLMRELLADLDAVGVPSADTLQHDRLLRRALERILTQLVDLAADINQHVVSSLGDAPASEYRESFDLAARHGLLPEDLATQLKPSVGTRNVLVHEYVNVDLALVARAIPMARDGYRRYVASVAAWIRRSTDIDHPRRGS